MKVRPAMTVLLALAVLFLTASLAWVLVQFGLPRPEWIEVGRLADFPPSEEPYKIYGREFVYFVNDGRNIMVIDPVNRVEGGGTVAWQSNFGVYVDPVRGSQFDLHGMPVHRFESYPIIENQSLASYPLKLDGDMIFFDRSHPEVKEMP